MSPQTNMIRIIKTTGKETASLHSAGKVYCLNMCKDMVQYWCVCVCVYVCVCVSLCVCVRQRERYTVMSKPGVASNQHD